MTPLSHTLYSITLFLALVTLNLWTGRRHRVKRTSRTPVLLMPSKKVVTLR
jgi:hypothetical protein